LFGQSLRRLEGATEFSGNVLAVDEDAVVFTEKMSLRFADRFEVGDAHEQKMTNDERGKMTNDE
jgi:hypothetical protein